MYKRNFQDFAVTIISYASLIALAAVTLLPFLNVASKSVSMDWAVTSGKVGLFPVGFQLENMEFVITNVLFLGAMRNSVLSAAAGTVLSILISCMCAYLLSKKHLPGVKFILILFIFTMIFNGGLIPTYLLYKSLNLLNNPLVLIFPNLLSVFNVLVIKSYYESLPESLEESAKVEGANNFVILAKIIIPVSKPVLATIALFYAVRYWNDYFNPMLYITKAGLKPLQVYLREVIIEMDGLASGLNRSMSEMPNVSSEGVRAATVIASTVPIVLVYPFLQKYFIKGIMIGSIKG